MIPLYSVKDGVELCVFDNISLQEGRTREISVFGKSVPVAKFDTFLLITPKPFTFEAGFDYFILWSDGEKTFLDFYAITSRKFGDKNSIECSPKQL